MIMLYRYLLGISSRYCEGVYDGDHEVIIVHDTITGTYCYQLRSIVGRFVSPICTYGGFLNCYSCLFTNNRKMRGRLYERNGYGSKRASVIHYGEVGYENGILFFEEEFLEEE